MTSIPSPEVPTPLESNSVRGGWRTPASLYKLITSSLLRTALGWDRPQRDVLWVRPRPNCICLEIGSGGGYYTRALKSRLGPESVLIALDPADNHETLEEQLHSIPGAQMVYVIGDGCRLPMADNHTDILFYGYSLEEMPDPLTAIREAHRVLRPGGELVIFLWRPVVTKARLRPILALLDGLFVLDTNDTGLQNIRLRYHKPAAIAIV